MKFRLSLIGIILAGIALVSIGCDESTTSDTVWREPTLLDNFNGNAYRPQIAADTYNNIMVVWIQDNESHTMSDIYCRKYSANSGWGSAAPVETHESSGYSYDVKLGSDWNMHFIAVWGRTEGSISRIYANRFTPDNGWGNAEIIQESSSSQSAPDVAVEPVGNAIAKWLQYDNPYWTLYATRYELASDEWYNPTPVESISGNVESASFAFDHNYIGVFAWTQGDIYARTHLGSTNSWNDDVITIDDTAISYDSPQVAMSPMNFTFIVWHVSSTVGNNIYYSKTDSGDDLWSDPATLDYTDKYSEQPQIAMDYYGNAVAMWMTQDNDTGTTSLYARRNSFSDGTWGGINFINTNSENGVVEYRLTMNGNGDMVVLWLEPSKLGYQDLYAGRIKAGSMTLEGRQLLDKGNGEIAYYNVAVDSDDNAIVVWQKNDNGVLNIYSKWLN
ncbi:MAG TPA: hypothetical protein PK573_12280 [Spirochaetota bacterium]|nr:hypothetical protein [Spirochaetota bacterium]HRZ27192.1 hypothetical protein [Spirochaetota bacterium]